MKHLPLPRIVLPAVLLLSGAGAIASAQERPEAPAARAAVTTDLGNNASALTYWVEGSDGRHVVTTVDTVLGDAALPEQDRHAVVRFSALIRPGELQVISVPGPAGAVAQALLIRAVGDHIEVTRVPQSAASIHAATPTG